MTRYRILKDGKEVFFGRAFQIKQRFAPLQSKEFIGFMERNSDYDAISGRGKYSITATEVESKEGNLEQLRKIQVESMPFHIFQTLLRLHGYTVERIKIDEGKQ